MAIDRAKLINLRNNVQAYLDSIERENKSEYMDQLVNAHTTELIDELREELSEKFERLTIPLPPPTDSRPVVEALENLGKRFVFPRDRTDEIVTAISNLRFPEVEFPDSISINNFPPQKIPQPVTNININGLRGPVKSTGMTVGATAVQMPNASLANRRSLIVWNNDDTEILWIGGADVSPANGIPVKAQNFSPALDLSDRVALYGITSGATIDVRILESSMTDIGA